MAPTAATIKPGLEARALPWASISWLYAIQAANLLVPLLGLPYLTRVLGAEPWGRLAFAQSFALVLGLVVEFGFNHSATRAIALHRDDPEELGDQVRATLAAQACAGVGVVALACLVRPWLPVVGADTALFWAAVAWMIPQAAGLQWYFQGFERMPAFSAATMLARALGVAALFVWVDGPEDAALALFLQAAAGLTLTIPLWIWVGRRHPGHWPRATVIGRALREGRALFVYRSGIYLWAVANTVALGFFGPEAQVGAYALAERLAKAVAGLLDPVSLALLPRLVRYRDGSAERAGRWLLGLLGVLLAAGLWFAGPVIVAAVAGHPWPEAAATLAVFAPYPLGVALGQAFGVHRLVPAGRDWALAAVVATAGVLHGLAIWALARLLPADAAHIGLAWAAVGSQFFQWAAFSLLRSPLRES